MEQLQVRALMSSPVIAVAPHTPLPQIKHVLRERQIRRVPVVDQDRLVGIITLGDVRNAFPSDATTLSIYELSYLLGRVTAADIMRTELITVSVEATVVEAAQLMLDHKVSGVPVLEDGRLVGMLTESDIFRALIAGSMPLPPAVEVVAQERPSVRARSIV